MRRKAGARRGARRAGRVLAGAAVAVLAGCSSTTGPTEGGVPLILRTVDGEAVPAVLVSWPDYHLELLADTIRFPREDAFRQHRVERLTGIDGVPRVRDHVLEGVAVRQPGRIVLVPACPPGADCLPGTILLASGPGYTTEWAVTPDSSRVLLYGPQGEIVF